MVKKGKGRQRTTMKKIDKDSNLQVTFSKRHANLFKKANELCILCDANVGLIVFTPRNKVHSFGHPSIHRVIDKFLPNTNVDRNFSGIMIISNQSQTFQELIRELNNVDENISILKARIKQLDDLKKDQEGPYWWDGPNKDKLTVEQLHMLKAMMEELKIDANIRKQNMNLESNNYMGELVINATTFVGPYDEMGNAYNQGIASFHPTTTDQSTGFVIPYEYGLNNEFDHETLNSFSNGHTIPFDPRVNDGVGPSGANILHQSANDYNRGYQ